MTISCIYDFYGFLAAKTLQQINASFDRTIINTGINGKQFGTMLIVGSNPGITQKEAGEMQRVDRTTIGQLVDFLCEKDLLERRPYPNDRRAYCLHLTNKGEVTLDQLKTISKQCEDEYFAPLSLQEREQFLSWLKKTIKENEHE